MRAPANIGNVHRFLGMVNQMSKFAPIGTEHYLPLIVFIFNGCITWVTHVVHAVDRRKHVWPPSVNLKSEAILFASAWKRLQQRLKGSRKALFYTSQPCKCHLLKSNQWVWGEPQQRTFCCIKEILTSSPVLALFDSNLEIIVTADTLRAVLLQRQPTGELKPIIFISKSMTPTEQR